MASNVASRAPGVYLEIEVKPPPLTLDTGVPVFLGCLAPAASSVSLFASTGTSGASGASIPVLDYTAWSRLDAALGTSWATGYLGFAVRGFFQNGGRRCFVWALPALTQAALADALASLDAFDGFDLICAPDLAASLTGTTDAQAAILRFAEGHTGCFAVLDGAGSNVPSLDVDADKLKASAADPQLQSNHGALYAPWLKVPGGCLRCGGDGLLPGVTSGKPTPCDACGGSGQGFVPPSGHVTGIYARVDGETGVHRAPANEALEGVIDVQVSVDAAASAALNQASVNAVRAFPGRGLRVWGARTLSTDSTLRFVNVQRVLLTIARWLELNMTEIAFEPNDFKLWVRISRQVGAFLQQLYESGALKGDSPDEAFYVKCDDETNPQAVRDLGMVVAEVGVAPARPNEHIVVRLVSGADGVVVSTGTSGAPGIG